MRKLFLTLIFVVALVTGALGQMATTIEPELLDAMNQLRDDEKISINIIMKAQFDVADLQTRASFYKDKKARRNFTVAEIKGFTESSQHDLLLTVNDLKANGLVEKVQTLWLANAVTCLATRDVVYSLSQRSDIQLIGYNRMQNMLFGEKAKPVTPSRDIANNVIQVNADDVWNLGYTGEGVLIAVVDTGVNYNHLDVNDHLWDGGADYPYHGFDTYNDDFDPMDDMGHGSHCAGTVCGDGTAGTQTGMAPDATLMCVKVLDAGGNGTANTICAGVDFAVEHGADIFSMSLGIPGSSSSERILFRNTMVNALATGIVGAVAAGNEGYYQYMYPVPNNVRVPGSCPPPWIHPDQEANSGELSCVVCVGSVNRYDQASDFTSNGPVTWQNISGFNDYPYSPGIGLIRPDVCAPGEGIISLYYGSNNNYTEMDGTSMATPCVAGVMALLMSKNPDITPAEMDMILETTGLVLTPNKSNITGTCRVDALAAAEAIITFPTKIESIVLNDSQGNNNGNLNPGETVSLDVIVENTTDSQINNAQLTLSTDNQHISIVNGNAEADLQANQILTIENAFSFTLSDEALANENINFTIQMIVDGETVDVEYEITVFNNVLNYSGIIIDDSEGNSNGKWDNGETVKVLVNIENNGNEEASKVVGVLTSLSDEVTVNQENGVFGNVRVSATEYFGFIATLDENATENAIPFRLQLTDSDGKQTEMEFQYNRQCNVIFELTDIGNNSWDGAALIVKFSDGTPDMSITVETGYSYTDTIEIYSGVDVTLDWQKGTKDYQCRYIISYEGGDEIYSGSGSHNTEFFTWNNNCSGNPDVSGICEAVKDLTANVIQNKVDLTWTCPNANVVSYDIYRGEQFIANTTDTNYSDENLEPDAYKYFVFTVYDDCQGLAEYVPAYVEMCDYVRDFNYEIINEELKVKFSWAEPEQNNEITGYAIYKNDELLVELGIDEKSYLVDIEPSSSNEYCVIAVYEKCEGPSSCLDLNICDYDVNMTYSIDGQNVTLNWEAPDTTFVYDYYLVHVEGMDDVTVTETTYTFAHEYGSVRVGVEPVSQECVSLFEYLDLYICNLEAVTGLTSATENSIVTLNWNESQSSQGYNVYRDGIKIAENIQATSFIDETIVDNGNYCYTVTSLCNSEESLASEDACAFINVGLDEFLAKDVKVYPNPSVGNFVIESKSITNITIYNVKGVIVKDVIVNADKYEINDLSEGMYFIKIQTESGSIIKRIVKL